MRESTPVVALLVAVSIATGCAPGYRAQTSEDDDGVVTDRMLDNEIALEGEGDYSDYAMGGIAHNQAASEQHCFLDAARRRQPDGTDKYYLLFSYTGSRELRIERRRTLELVIDEYYSTTLRGERDVERIASRVEDKFTENFDYAVSADVLIRMAQAEQVELIVTGGEFELKGYFVDRNFRAFREFVKAYVEPSN